MVKPDGRAGVYLCHQGGDTGTFLDISLIRDHMEGLEGVAVCRECGYLYSSTHLAAVRKDVREHRLECLLVVSCSRYADAGLLAIVLRETGLRKDCIEVVNPAHQVEIKPDNIIINTQRTMEMLETMLSSMLERASTAGQEETRNFSTLVLGGGTAGIETSIKLAESGMKVYLVEKDGSLGGRVSKLNKLYPALENAHCYILPRMTLAASHHNIELYTLSDVEAVDEQPDGYHVKVTCKSRYVKPGVCDSCGECVKVCPVERPDEFNEHMMTRKAIYKPFPEAVPASYIIEKGEMPPCRRDCPIDQDAPGYIYLINQGKYREAYELIRLKNPLPSVVARICQKPCEDHCRRGDEDNPISIKRLKQFVTDWAYENKVEASLLRPTEQHSERVAVVGAGPAGLACAHELRYGGYHVSVFEESYRAGGLLVTEIPDFRIPQDKISFDIEQIRKMGIEFKFNTRIGDRITLTDLRKQYDAVFIGTGAQRKIRGGIPGEMVTGCFDAQTFLHRCRAGEKIVLGDVVAVIGGDNAALYCAIEAVKLGAKKVTVFFEGSEQDARMDAELTALAGSHAVEIIYNRKPKRIVSAEGHVSALECVRTKTESKGADSEFVLKEIPDTLETFPVKTVLIVADRQPDMSFNRGTAVDLRMTGLNTVWVDDTTMETSVEGIFAGGDVTIGSGSVMKAIAAGKRAARSIHLFLRGQPVEHKLPARMTNKNSIMAGAGKESRNDRNGLAQPGEAQGSQVGFKHPEMSESGAIEESARCLRCGVCIDCWECSRVCASNAIDHEMKDRLTDITAGNVVIASGHSLFNPEKIPYMGYGKMDNVFTAMEFERMSSPDGPTSGKIILKNGKPPESAAIIHCIGSRDKRYHEYCSEICCMYSMKFAAEIKKRIAADVYQLYVDIRGSGKHHESFYGRMRREGVRFIRGKAGEITDCALHPEENGKLVVCCDDTLMGNTRRIPVDMVILAPAVEAPEDAVKIAGLFRIDVDEDGFFAANDSQFPSIITSMKGIYVVGTCQRSMNVHDTVLHAHAAAAAILATAGNT